MNGAWGTMGEEMNSLLERTEVEKTQVARGQREEEHPFFYSLMPYKYIAIPKGNVWGMKKLS